MLQVRDVSIGRLRAEQVDAAVGVIRAKADNAGIARTVDGRFAGKFAEEGESESRECTDTHRLAFGDRVIRKPDGRRFAEVGDAAARAEQNPLTDTEDDDQRYEPEENAGDDRVEDVVKDEGAIVAEGFFRRFLIAGGLLVFRAASTVVWSAGVFSRKTLT